MTVAHNETNCADAGLIVPDWCDACRRELEGVRHCRVCGCTEADACAIGCWWVPDPAMLGDLCSTCGWAIRVPSP